jgi:hypothetical protein
MKVVDLQWLPRMPEKHFVWDQLGASPPQLLRLAVATVAERLKEPRIRSGATDAET